jgi:hypothetical protein
MSGERKTTLSRAKLGGMEVQINIKQTPIQMVGL